MGRLGQAHGAHHDGGVSHGRSARRSDPGRLQDGYGRVRQALVGVVTPVEGDS